MSVTIRDLLKLELFKSTIKLISDKSNTDAMVTWPYIKQTNKLKPWINGGEIIFVTGNEGEKTAKEQIDLIKEGYENGVAAFVFLYGSKNHIDNISQEVIDYSNKIKIPLFIMPYKVKLIDVTREISNAIIMSGSRERMILNFINDLLHQDYPTESHIIKQGYEFGINLENPYMIMALETDFDYEGKSYDKIMSYRNTMTYVLKRIEQIGTQYDIHIISLFHLERSLCFFFMENTAKIKKICNETEEFLSYYFGFNELSVFAGYSNIHKGVKPCLKAVDEATNAMVFSQKSEGNKISCHYNELGILKLLVTTNSKAVLKDYCTDIIGVLIDSDKTNNTEYVITAKTYLENNNSLVTTADRLFIHRNTLINRIKRIEELTGKSLKDSDVKLEFLCAFKILEFLIT